MKNLNLSLAMLLMRALSCAAQSAYLEVLFVGNHTFSIGEDEITLLEEALIDAYNAENLGLSDCTIASATALLHSIIPGDDDANSAYFSWIMELKGSTSCAAGEFFDSDTCDCASIENVTWQYHDEVIGLTWDSPVPVGVTGITSMQLVNPVECGGFEYFESSLAVNITSKTGNANGITADEKDLLAQAVVHVYNDLAGKFCDHKFRSLDTAGVINEGGRRRLLEETHPGDELTRKLQYNPFLNLEVDIRYSCWECGSVDGLFDQVRRMLEEGWMVPPLDQQARNLNHEGQCFCRQDVPDRGQSSNEFVTALRNYVVERPGVFPNVEDIVGVKEITSNFFASLTSYLEVSFVGNETLVGEADITLLQNNLIEAYNSQADNVEQGCMIESATVLLHPIVPGDNVSWIIELQGEAPSCEDLAFFGPSPTCDCAPIENVTTMYKERLADFISNGTVSGISEITSMQLLNHVECGDFEEFASSVTVNIGSNTGNANDVTPEEKDLLAEAFVHVYNDLAGQYCDHKFRSLDTAVISDRRLLEETHPGNELTRKLQYNPFLDLGMDINFSCFKCGSVDDLFDQINRMLEEEWMVPPSDQQARNLMSHEGQCFCRQDVPNRGQSNAEFVAALNNYVDERRQLGFPNVEVILVVTSSTTLIPTSAEPTLSPSNVLASLPAYLEVSFMGRNALLGDQEIILLENALIDAYNDGDYPTCTINSATVLSHSIVPGNVDAYPTHFSLIMELQGATPCDAGEFFGSNACACPPIVDVTWQYKERLAALIWEGTVPGVSGITSMQLVNPVECGGFEYFESSLAVNITSNTGNANGITADEKDLLAQAVVHVYNDLAGQFCDHKFRSLDTSEVINDWGRRRLLKETYHGDELTRKLQYNPFLNLEVDIRYSCWECGSVDGLFDQINRMLEEEWMVPPSDQQARNLMSHEGQCFCRQDVPNRGQSNAEFVAALNIYVVERPGDFPNVGEIIGINEVTKPSNVFASLTSYIEVSFVGNETLVVGDEITLLQDTLIEAYNSQADNVEKSCTIKNATVLLHPIISGNALSWIIELQGEAPSCEDLAFFGPSHKCDCASIEDVITLFKTKLIASIWSHTLDGVSGITSMHLVDRVSCGDFEEFESSVAVESTGDPDNITFSERGLLAKAFIHVYNDLAGQYCDYKFRSLDIAEVIYVDEVEEVRRRLLEETHPGDELTRKLQYNPFANLLLEASGRCATCKFEKNLFDQTRRMLEEEWMIPPSDQPARNLMTHEDQCFCRRGVSDGGQSNNEFVVTLSQYVQDRPNDFPNVGVILAVNEITSDITSSCVSSSVSRYRDSVLTYFE